MKTTLFLFATLVLLTSSWLTDEGRSESIADRMKSIDNPLATQILHDLQSVAIGMYNGHGKATVRETGEDANEPARDYDRIKSVTFFGSVDTSKLEGYFREDIEEDGKTIYQVSSPTVSFSAVKTDGKLKLQSEDDYSRSLNILDSFTQISAIPMNWLLNKEDQEIVALSFKRDTTSPEKVLLKAEVIGPSKSQIEWEIEFTNVAGFVPSRYRFVKEGLIISGKLEHEAHGKSVAPKKATIETKSESGKSLQVIDILEYKPGAVSVDRFTKKTIGL
ncbi:hypothetical protein VN12_17425 [Pirellula sp. SH-Sr6A]|uniref:hypothetical protein n=1 Tax=Pirellula sp. SH-Sr6A TaxID=1632865 RepID=UPI00078CC667|nr:hypothetical protein [Pirellula sp. SH-Sr6A]AMV33914.1 hypothetical protein VN12_17425 [Pirellula sp. SH-Sr6A]